MASRARTVGKKPTEVRLTTYRVGFGDCFLLTVVWGAARASHVLLDFGTIALPQDAPSNWMTRIARDLVRQVGGDDLVVVATHRHRDHISGFGGSDTGRLIKGLKPKLVLQPWTESPALGPSSTGPVKSAERAHALRLGHMQLAGQLAERELLALDLPSAVAAFARADIRKAHNNVANAAAVASLRTMAKKCRYLRAGDPVSLGWAGVDVHVLGPPSLREAPGLNRYAKESDQYWPLFSASAPRAPGSRGHSRPFADAHQVGGDDVPVADRWFLRRLERARFEQLRAIVHVLDEAINNTSLILLFEIAGLKLLFPGDAQVESWTHAMALAERDPTLRRLLRSVDVYKVGHHGSKNATPRDLWRGFAKATQRGELHTFLSTDPNMFPASSYDGAVPRPSLVRDLTVRSRLTRTDALRAGVIGRRVVFRRTANRWQRSARDEDVR